MKKVSPVSHINERKKKLVGGIEKFVIPTQTSGFLSESTIIELNEL